MRKEGDILNGKVTIVTGAGGGIGKKFSEALGKAGLHLLLIVLLVVGGCATLKAPPTTPDVLALPSATSGTLHQVSSEFAATHPPGKSGFLLLSDNAEALHWRLALVDQATVSIDAQYFIWEADEVGTLLFDRLLKAADRGVRVRLLVDDLCLATSDRAISSYTQHPNFDIRVFNPGRVRESTIGALGEFFLYFKQLNRRMHNKLFIVDNRLAIIGGRNIGNPYFGLSKKYNFRDLDVLVVGPVVEESSDAFDEYWNSEMSEQCHVQ